jgi:hypothetical protein
MGEVESGWCSSTASIYAFCCRSCTGSHSSHHLFFSFFFFFFSSLFCFGFFVVVVVVLFYILVPFIVFFLPSPFLVLFFLPLLFSLRLNINQTMYVFGGYGEGTVVLNDMYQFDLGM